MMALAAEQERIAQAACHLSAAAAAQRAKQCADAADDARRSAELAAAVRQAVTHTIQDMVSSVASEPFKHCFDFDELPAKKLKYLVQQLKSKIDTDPPATHKGKAPMIHWLQASPEKQLRDVVVKALPAAQLDAFVHEHFPHATCKADIM